MPDGLFRLLLKIEFDDLMDVLQCFVQGLPLRITPRKEGTLHHIEAIFIFFDKNREMNLIGSFHAILIVGSTLHIIKNRPCRNPHLFWVRARFNRFPPSSRRGLCPRTPGMKIGLGRQNQSP
ncbi:hypothetical protein J2129_000109 [Methanofollis sp. W23]|nr:hypothetical protein [Methanofollis sp. W23]